MSSTNAVEIDITKVPFSKYGSYIALSYDESEHKFTIHHTRRPFGEDLIFTLKFLQNQSPAEITVTAYPHLLLIRSANSKAQIYLQQDDSVIIESHGLDIQLNMVSGRVNWGYGTEKYPTAYGTQISEQRFKMIRVDARLFAGIDVFFGKASLDGAFEKNQKNGVINYGTVLRVNCCPDDILLSLKISHKELGLSNLIPDFEEEIAVVRQQWENFLAKMPTVPDDRKHIAEMSWYNLWSSFVRAEDCYKYDAMLMSKNFMCSVWTWDHCFNSLAISYAEKETALQQFLLPFELQSECGALPDFFNPGQEIVWGVTKPPVHGWCFHKLLQQHTFDSATLQKVYAMLQKWTDWWMSYRDSDADGIPEYPQGCDSGQDNSTLFDDGFFLESPDLSAFLILQMRTLAEIAALLRNAELSRYWQKRSEKLYGQLIEHNWIGERFVAKKSRSHEFDANPTSIISILPIVLGEYLDANIMARLVEILEKDFLTENGPATEALSSPYYESNSYWRGPIWAPTTYLIIDGLNRAGYTALAKKIARSFCDMIRDKAQGNFENFDAVTGQGLRAPGYTWTASVHLLLIFEYLS
jgi:putative isomerase